MKELILHPTEMSQWYALVNEAEYASHLTLSESTESYLVFLLMRFTHNAQLMDSVIAIEFLESLQHNSLQQIDQLRDVGDKSLLFCGLFPGMAEKRRVNLEYYINMGQAAYLTIGELQKNQQAPLYYELSKRFTTIQQVLNAMRGDFIQYSRMCS